MLQMFIVANTDKRIRKRIMQKGRKHMFSYITTENTFTYLACYMLSNVLCGQTQIKHIVQTLQYFYIFIFMRLKYFIPSTSFKILDKVALQAIRLDPGNMWLLSLLMLWWLPVAQHTAIKLWLY